MLNQLVVDSLMIFSAYKDNLSGERLKKRVR